MYLQGSKKGSKKRAAKREQKNIASVLSKKKKCWLLELVLPSPDSGRHKALQQKQTNNQKRKLENRKQVTLSHTYFVILEKKLIRFISPAFLPIHPTMQSFHVFVSRTEY